MRALIHLYTFARSKTAACVPGELPSWKSCMQTRNADALWLLCTTLAMQSSCNCGLRSWLKGLYSCFAVLRSTKQSETHHRIWSAALPEVPLCTETSVLVLVFFFLSTKHEDAADHRRISELPQESGQSILLHRRFSGRTCHWSPKSQQRLSAHLFHFWFLSRLVTLFFVFLDGSFKNTLQFALQLPSRDSVSLCGYL